MHFISTDDSLESAKDFDSQDELRSFRSEFVYPGENEKNIIYFAGHSLGLMPKRAKEFINEELHIWGSHAVHGQFKGERPWVSYHEHVTESYARLVGAKPIEVVAMNGLTVNLHLVFVSFYRPTKSRYKILIENNTFPSDKYAVDSQARFHGFPVDDAILQLQPRPGEMIVREEDILEQITNLGDSLALVLLGNCNYLSGQCFNMPAIVKAAHEIGAVVGFNLAHGAGNLQLKLHDWHVDFAVWCSYKYLNAGPGGIAGMFIHEKHVHRSDLPRLTGWWGHNKNARFKMEPNFEPISSAEAWQLSNPPIFQLAALRASMDLFDKASMEKIVNKSKHLTGYFEFLLKKNCQHFVEIITPASRGSMLCLRFKQDPKKYVKYLQEHHAIVDFREPDIVRATPAPLYNSYEDVYRFVALLQEVHHEA